MFNSYYDSHIKSALDMRSVMTDVIEAEQKRYAEMKEREQKNNGLD